MANIFSPLQIRDVAFQNRIVMAPMVRFGYQTDNGVMGEDLLQEYMRSAGTGIGLVIVQLLAVSHYITFERGAGTSGGAGMYADEHAEYLKRLADSFHQGGTRLFAQLGITGYGYDSDESKDVNDLTTADLEEIREQFIHAAWLCKSAGADGIELHGAHTYFLNMMASPVTNRRKDRYGGDPDGRLRLVKEIVRGIRGFAGDDFLIGYRMGWGNSLDDDIETAKALEQAGVDVLHVSFGIPRDREMELPADYAYSKVVYTGCQTAGHIGIPTIAVNDIQTLARGDALIRQGACDFVAYGKPFLADPAFVEHSADRMDYRPCYGCRECRWFRDGRKCPSRLRLGS